MLGTPEVWAMLYREDSVPMSFTVWVEISETCQDFLDVDFEAVGQSEALLAFWLPLWKAYSV